MVPLPAHNLSTQFLHRTLVADGPYPTAVACQQSETAAEVMKLYGIQA